MWKVSGMCSRSWLLAVGGLAMVAASRLAIGQVVVPGADGSDGEFHPTSNTKIRLDLAPTGSWDGPNAEPGKGVYDPDKWAIIFRYSEVNIPAGVTVSFFNHPSNPPVVWLVSGPVTIDGTVSVSPSGGVLLGYSLPGPGGFRGGGSNTSGGLGPGGALPLGFGGSFATGTAQYGNSRCLPLVGGSGGRGTANAVPGSGNYGYGYPGAGAILIATPGSIALNGTITANAQPNYYADAGGSGGAIRLICNSLEGTGKFIALGASDGRIRVEANQIAFASVGTPTASQGLPGATATLWPLPNAPDVRVLSLGPAAVPADPLASFEFPYADVNLTHGAGQTLVIECRNVPTGSDPEGTEAWTVAARVAPRGAVPFIVNAEYVSGDYELSTWHAVLGLPTGFAAIQVRASMPPQVP